MKKTLLITIILSLVFILSLVPVLGQVTVSFSHAPVSPTLSHRIITTSTNPQTSFTTNMIRASKNDLQIDRVYFPDGEYVKKRNSFTIAVDIDSDLPQRINDVSLSIYIPELGIFIPVGKRDIKRNSNGFWIAHVDSEDFVGISEQELMGDHLVRIVVEKDNLRRVTYRIVTIE